MAKLINQTIGELLSDRVKQSADQEAVVYSSRGLRFTYKTFFEETTRLAKGLMGLGIKKGEHIAVWATNVPEWILLQFASARIGAVLVTVNTSYQEKELEYLLKQSDTTTLFLIDAYKGVSYTDTAIKVWKSGACPKLQRMVYIGDEGPPDHMLHFNSLNGLGEEITDKALKERETSLEPGDVINMQYTSGTTGFPKGVMLTHLNIINNAFQVATAMGLKDGDRLCIPVPLFHCFGCVMSTLASVTVGAVMVPVVTFDPEEVLRVVEAEKCTALHGVPTMFIAEMNHPHFEDFRINTLKRGIMAGSTCPIEVMKQVMEEMGMTDITIAYGQTESSPVITQTRTYDSIERKVNTVGQVLPLVEAKVIDPVTGKESGIDIQGELYTRGYHVMKGYYNNDAATNSAIDDEGWLHTGDLATVDRHGYYKITGRLKDMIIRGGENVYPREIEEFLYSHPDVMDVQIIGIPDEKYGETVVAYVQKRQGTSLDEAKLKDYCKGKIAFYKIPKHILFTDQYPMTASGKIQKYKLRSLAQEQLKIKKDMI
ncbi:fatty-acyl-CoA synthase [Scopulibacillus darangshiensis]|uniref:Fatty-acyl-CoA synthase n=1 Tax=Scopulibacillus darangshiensis TaxID=442528 RepID=A0A4R2PB76_9BACL|nr:AMP-binding protein [Scopulibacillus darangshiensis]TCP32359.1 fatty-acyl-CoA synthase [Scopulibacillus darangshiensis]